MAWLTLKNTFFQTLTRIGWDSLDDDALDEIEQLLLMADCGLTITDKVIATLKKSANSGNWQRVLTDCLEGLLPEDRDERTLFHPLENRSENLTQNAERTVGDTTKDTTKHLECILMVGTNGAGKTTTIAKLAARYQGQGKRVMVAAGDTFRAAATAQLGEWAARLNIPIVEGAANQEPAALAHTAYEAAVKANIDILLVDTAGRQSNAEGLMRELEKVHRVLTARIAKEHSANRLTTWLVMDAVAGQNGLRHARAYQAYIPLDGLIITKLDGSAKGGVVFAANEALQCPILYIGQGEQMADIRPFARAPFVASLLAP